MMSGVDFNDVARFVFGLLVVIGGGAMVWYGKAPPETVYAVIGVVLGFYFGSTSTAAVTRAVTRALGKE